MKLQGNDEKKNEKFLRKLFKKNPKICQLTLGIKPFRSSIKGKSFARKKFKSRTVCENVLLT